MLARALAGTAGYDPDKDRSPFGAKPAPRRQYAMLKPNLADMVAADYIQPVAEGARAVGGFVREHPAETTAGIAAGLTMPVSAMGLLGAGALGIAGRAIDKTHPLTDERMDYGRETGTQTAKDLALAGGVNALFHGVFGPTPVRYDANALGEAVRARGPMQGYTIPVDDADNLLFRSSSDDPMHGIDPIYDPRELDPTIMLRADHMRLSNLNRQAMLSEIGTPDRLPIRTYRGISDVDGPVNPRYVAEPGQQATDVYMAGRDNPALARSYVEAGGQEPDYIIENIDHQLGQGTLSSTDAQLANEAKGNLYSSDIATQQLGYAQAKRLGMVEGVGGHIQTLEVLPKTPRYVDMKGLNMNSVDQEMINQQAWDEGHDAIVYQNVVDHANAMVPGAMKPSDVVVVAPNKHGIIQSPYGGYSGDPTNIFKSIPLAAGLGGLGYGASK